MNLPRIFAQAVVRRIAAFCALSLVCWLGIGKASAQTDPYPNCFSTYQSQQACATQSDAYAAAYGLAVSIKAAVGPNAKVCPEQPRSLGPTSMGITVRVTHNSSSATCSGSSWNTSITRTYPLTGSCSNRPSSVTQFLPATGSTQCWQGCKVVYAQNADDTSTRSTTGDACIDDQFKQDCPVGSFWNGYMSVCEPIQKQCPEGQEERDGQCLPSNKCPAGMVSVQGSTPGAIQQGSLYCKPAKEECPPGDVTTSGGQCLPGDGKCAQGEARGGDGTCKRDADGDGVADDEDDNPDNDSQKDSFSGGDNCDAPPTCNGNPIMCGQARIQWRIECNTRRAQNISGGTCDTVPICTGKSCDAMEYAQLMQQWRSTCALEKIANQEPGQGGGENPQGDANGNGVADVLEGRLNSSGAGDGQADVDGSRNFGIGVNAGMLNSEAIFGGGSCPRPPSFQLYGQTISADDFPYWCDAMLILRGLVLLFGAFTALKILMGWGF